MLKYIYIRERDGTEFPAFCMVPMTHLELALSLQSYKPGRTIVSAGFVEFTGSEARTYGRSESLNLGPRNSDHVFLTTFARATATAAAASLNEMAATSSR